MTPLRSRLLAVLAAFVMAGSLAACGSPSGGGADTNGRGRLSVGAAAIPSSLDPRKSAPYEAQWIGMLYDTLLQRAPDGTFRPALAESWTLSPDGHVLDLTLRGIRYAWERTRVREAQATSREQPA